MLNLSGNFGNQIRDVALWSGGCDSALMLYKLAQDGRPLLAVSVDHYMQPYENQVMQSEARQKQAEFFHKKGLNIKYVNLVVSSSRPDDYILLPGGLPQNPLWIAEAMMYLPVDGTLHLGYNMDDLNFWPMYHAVKNMFDFMCIVKNSQADLEVPLQKMKKSAVIKELMDIGLYDLTWYCNVPTKDFKPCENCISCRAHLKAKGDI